MSGLPCNIGGRRPDVGQFGFVHAGLLDDWGPTRAWRGRKSELCSRSRCLKQLAGVPSKGASAFSSCCGTGHCGRSFSC